MSVEPIKFSFKNMDGDKISAKFDPNNTLMRLKIKSKGYLLEHSIGFRFSMAPENDDLSELLFRDLELIRGQETDMNNCSSFKFFTKITEKDCNGQKESVKVTIIKFGHKPEDQYQTAAKIASVGFGVLGGGLTYAINAGLVAGPVGFIAGAVSSVAMGMAWTAGEHGFASEEDYRHQKFKDEMKQAASRGTVTGVLTGFLGPLIGKLSVVGQAANSVVSKVPLHAKTVVRAFVAAGTSGPVNAIADWHEGKPFMLDKLFIKSLSGMAGTLVSDGLLRDFKANDKLNGAVRSSGFRVWDKTLFGGLGGGARQMTQNVMEGKPASDNLGSSILLDGSLAYVGAWGKESGKIKPTPSGDQSSKKEPVQPTLKKVSPNVSKSPHGQLIQLCLDGIENYFSPTFDKYQNDGSKWVDIDGLSYDCSPKHRPAIAERLANGGNVVIRHKNGTQTVLNVNEFKDFNKRSYPGISTASMLKGVLPVLEPIIDQYPNSNPYGWNESQRKAYKEQRKFEETVRLIKNSGEWGNETGQFRMCEEKHEPEIRRIVENTGKLRYKIHKQQGRGNRSIWEHCYSISDPELLTIPLPTDLPRPQSIISPITSTQQPTKPTLHTQYLNQPKVIQSVIESTAPVSVQEGERSQLRDLSSSSSSEEDPLLLNDEPEQVLRDQPLFSQDRYQVVKLKLLQKLENEKQDLENRMSKLSAFLDKAPSKIQNARSKIRKQQLRDKVVRAQNLHANYQNEWLQVCKNKDLISKQNGIMQG